MTVPNIPQTEPEPAKKRLLRTWQFYYLITAATLVTCCFAIAGALAIHGHLNRPPPLPVATHPPAEATGFQQVASQTLVESIHLNIARHHQTAVRHALALDVQRHGGRIIADRRYRVTAVTTGDHAAQLRRLFQPDQPRRHLDPAYQQWATETLAGAATGVPEPRNPAWTSVTIKINAKWLPNRATSLAAEAAIYAGMSLLISMIPATFFTTGSRPADSQRRASATA